MALRRPNGGPQTSSETLSAAGGHCLRGVPRASHNEGLDPDLTRTGGGRSTPSRALTKLIIEIRVSLRGSEVIARPVYPPEPAPSWGESPRRAPRHDDPEYRTPTMKTKADQVSYNKTGKVYEYYLSLEYFEGECTEICE